MLCQAISMAQPSSPSHAEAVAPPLTCRGDAIRMKMTAVSLTSA